ncbi:MAG TPA: hypothetical protein VIM19_18555 [Actinomycetes bacterium]
MKINLRIGAGVVAAAAVLSVLATSSPASAHEIQRGQQGQDRNDSRGLTTVVLNQSLVGALVGLGVAPVAPGTLTAPGGTHQVAFPITSIEDGRIGHSGGLDFSKASAGDVKITRFVVDTNAGFLTAKTSVNGTRIGRIAVFKLGPVQDISPGVTPSCAGVAAGLTLTPAAAGALLGDSTATAFIGDACVVPSGDDD